MASPQFVLDNSVVMAWIFKDEVSRYAQEVQGSLDAAEAVVPAIWPLEIGNVLVVGERRGRLSKADSAHLMALVSELPITVEQESPERMLGEIVALARDQHLSTYDASYLDLAMRLGVPLATLDASLLKAAKNCLVTAYDPQRPPQKI